MESLTIEALRFVSGIVAICSSVLTGAIVMAGTQRTCSLDGNRFLAGLIVTSEEAKSSIEEDAELRITTLRSLVLSNVKWGISVIFTSLIVMIFVEEFLSPVIRLVILIMLAAHAFLVVFEMYWGFSEIAYPPRAKASGK